MSLKKKIPILIIALLIISIAVTSVFTSYESSVLMTKMSKSELQSVSKRSIEAISALIEKELSNVNGLSSNKTVYDFLQKSLNTDPENSDYQAYR